MPEFDYYAYLRDPENREKLAMHFLLETLDERGFPRKSLDIIAENPWINPTPEFIIKAVAKYFEISDTDILGKDRSSKIAEPRKIAMYMVRDMTNESFPKMGKIFGKDHTTVKYAVDSLEEQLKTDSVLREKIQDVKNSVLTP